jgi:uncharacterized protein YbgA (DUF1722 family)/uncharacterized protein YbbK (DUF523 family)
VESRSRRSDDPRSQPIRIGISACLLGQTVRYDGGHKRDAFLADVLAPFVEWVPVCPVVECGVGTPRPAMRLVQTDAGVRLLTIGTGADLTDRMARYASRRVAQLERETLSGYVLKKNSPSCGLERVKVYGVRGGVDRSGLGLFAARLLERFPSLPIEEEGRLSDQRLRENFIERVFAYARLRDLFTSRWTLGSLVRFHTAHKLLLMAHSPRAYAALGRVVAGASAAPRSELAARYTGQFMSAMALIATSRRHVNVLQHCAGYFKRLLPPSSKAELQQVIDDYRRGIVPLIVPITLLRHHVRVHDVTYLAGQAYLDPHPKELMLRNHV